MKNLKTSSLKTKLSSVPYMRYLAGMGSATWQEREPPL